MNSRRFAIISFVFCLLNGSCFGQDSSLAPSDVVHRQVVCIWETFNADCGQNKVVLIVEAFFGRMRNGSSCSIELGSGESPCFADIQLYAERRCSGRRRCSFKPIDDDLRFFSGSCTPHAEKFMSIVHRCEEVYSADNETCFGNRSLVVTSSSGYLSNTVTEESGKGSSLCPWRFQPREGQTVIFTLLDFGVWQGRGEPSGHHNCRIYAWIRHLQPNSQAPADITICHGNERERLIFQSTTTTVEVLMSNQSTANKVYFLIRFQIECPKIDAPLGADVEKSREGTRIYCVDDRQRFLDLRCEAGHWIPEINLTCPTNPLASSPASFSSSTSSYSEFSPTEVDSLKEDSWEKYLVSGGLLLIAVVVVVIVVVIVVVMYRNRRIDRKRKSESCATPIADNPYYSAGQLLIGAIYEEIQDSNLSQTPERSSSDSVPAAKINCTPLSSRNDPHLKGRSPEQSPDALNAGPPKYPPQCRDPSAEEPTYLLPREEERSSTFQPFTNKLTQNETLEII